MAAGFGRFGGRSGRPVKRGVEHQPRRLGSALLVYRAGVGAEPHRWIYPPRRASASFLRLNPKRTGIGFIPLLGRYQPSRFRKRSNVIRTLRVRSPANSEFRTGFDTPAILSVD
jgi:hypothetical protein